MKEEDFLCDPVTCTSPVPVTLFPPMLKVGPSNYLVSSLPTVPLQEVVAWNRQELSKLLDTLDCLESQVKAQSLKASGSKALHCYYREAETEKNCLVKCVEIKSPQTEKLSLIFEKFFVGSIKLKRKRLVLNPR